MGELMSKHHRGWHVMPSDLANRDKPRPDNDPFAIGDEVHLKARRIGKVVAITEDPSDGQVVVVEWGPENGSNTVFRWNRAVDLERRRESHPPSASFEAGWEAARKRARDIVLAYGVEGDDPYARQDVTDTTEELAERLRLMTKEP